MQMPLGCTWTEDSNSYTQSGSIRQSPSPRIRFGRAGGKLLPAARQYSTTVRREFSLFRN